MLIHYGYVFKIKHFKICQSITLGTLPITLKCKCKLLLGDTYFN